MRFIIRGVRERAPFFSYLNERLPEAEWCWDKTHNAMDTFLSAMRMAGQDPAVHMEDDVILCRSFREKIAEEIAKRPGKVIQFFSMRKADLEIGSRYDRSFMMNQCFYLPAGYSEEIWGYYPSWPRKVEHPTGYDILIQDWLNGRREKYWIVVPNLVDHRICQSLINPRRSSRRQSLTFREDY